MKTQSPENPARWKGILTNLGDFRIIRALRYRERGDIFGPEHSHPSWHHLIYLVKGQTGTRIEGEIHEVAEDSVLFVRAGQRHGSVRRPRVTFESIEVRFDTETPAALASIPPLPPVVKLPLPAAILAGFERITASFLTGTNQQDWLTRVQLVELLLLLEREVEGTPRAISANSDTACRIHQAAEHIAVHFAEPLSVDDLASLVGMSPNYFAVSFRKTIGVSPIEHAMRTRLVHAKELLRSSPLSVDEVARSTGFRTARYLSRVFQKRLGLSPSAFRNKVREEPVG